MVKIAYQVNATFVRRQEKGKGIWTKIPEKMELFVSFRSVRDSDSESESSEMSHTHSTKLTGYSQ